jgi:predicted ATP-grasp superfamily ATP-dependent carboligase
VDVVRALYLSLTDQPVPATRVHEGRKWIVENQDLSSYLVYRRDRKLTLWEFVSSFKGVKERAWFAADDLRPFVKLCQGYLRKALGWGSNGFGALLTTCELLSV